MSGIQIGRVAERTGLTIDAIRFYEKQRLFGSLLRTSGGFRLFSERDVQRIEFIRRAQDLGFSLNEIRDLLAIQRDEDEACSHVRGMLQAKVALVRGKIKELAILEQQLANRLRKCERILKHSGDSHQECCPVIEEIARPR